MNFLKLKLGYNILNMNYLLGFHKMTFKIHLIFTSLAGIIFRPLFSTFCSCYKFYTLSRKKSLFFRVKHMVLLLTFDEFLFQEKFILVSTASSGSSLFFIVFNTMHFIVLDVSSLFLMWKIIFNHTWRVTAQDVFLIYSRINVYCIRCMLCHFVFHEILEVKKCFWHSMHVIALYV